MFELDDLRKTKVAQEFLEEGRQQRELEIIQVLLNRGVEVEIIAEIVQRDVETTKKIIASLPTA